MNEADRASIAARRSSGCLPLPRPCALASGLGFAGAQAAESPAAARGYGTDPDLMRLYQPGDVWPLTLLAERRTAAASGI